MSSDETYLEAFIESLSTLPHEVRRAMDLTKDLDASCSTGTEKLKELYQEYIRAAEEKMMQLEIVQSRNADGTATTAGVRVLGGGDDVIIPSTSEFMSYTYDAEKYAEIQRLQQECLQKSDEKVAIAGQAYDIVDATVKRLDRDLEAMEQLLQATGDFHSGAAPKPNDLAACQVTPGSDWILAKVLQHDPSTGRYKLADEDVESNKTYNLPEAQVILAGVEKVSRGETIFAVYPDTTSFYQAQVVQAPRKTAAGGGTFVMVNFVDDSDEFGVTHDKAVPLKHVIHPPFGANIQ